MTVVRDSRYLTWRYVRCPVAAYHCLGLYDRPGGRLEALAVVRPEFPGWPFAVLADWVVPQDRPEVGAALLAACEDLARAAGRAQLFTWVPSWSPEAAFFRAQGYRDEPTPYRIVASAHTPRPHAGVGARALALHPRRLRHLLIRRRRTARQPPVMPLSWSSRRRPPAQAAGAARGEFLLSCTPNWILAQKRFKIVW